MARASAGSLVRNEGLGPQQHDSEGGMTAGGQLTGQGGIDFLNGDYCLTVSTG